MEQKKKCRKCGSENCVGWGKRKGKQCHRCKDCGFQFTRDDERKSQKDVFRAVALYCTGLSFRTIGALMNYHNTTILGWIVEFAERNYHKPIPKSDIIVELDEMHHYLKSKKTSFGYGKHIVERLANYSTGKLEIEVPELLKRCILD